jgi:hypothetical protein
MPVIVTAPAQFVEKRTNSVISSMIMSLVLVVVKDTAQVKPPLQPTVAVEITEPSKAIGSKAYVVVGALEEAAELVKVSV